MCIRDSYGVRHFAYDQGFGAVMRYNFKQDAGQEITLCRISPDCKKLFVGKGTIVGGGDYDLDNCNGYVVFRAVSYTHLTGERQDRRTVGAKWKREDHND